MATKFLRKIILEELQKILKEEVGPRSGQFSGTTITDWARNDSTGNNKKLLLTTNPDNEESVKVLMKSIYGSDFNNAYNNSGDIAAFRKGLIDAKESAGEKGEYITTGPGAEGPSIPKQVSVSPSTDMFNIAADGKWGVKCRAAEDIQATIRSKIDLSSIDPKKKAILMQSGKSGRGRLGDGIMGASTLSVLNYVMKKHNLGMGFSEYPMNRKGAIKACNDKRSLALAIREIENIKPEELAGFFMPKEQETNSTGTAVAQSDTPSKLAESKLLENKILRELAKMLNK